MFAYLRTSVPLYNIFIRKYDGKSKVYLYNSETQKHVVVDVCVLQGRGSASLGGRYCTRCSEMTW